MADIVVLPGVERRDIGDPVPSEDVLRCAIESGLTDVIVIGRDRSGEHYLAAAIADADRIVGRLLWAVDFLVRCKVVQTKEVKS